jgi:hypothetical protein
MDSQTQYCLMRRDLEERVWRLTSRVPELTSELIMQIGPLSDMLCLAKIQSAGEAEWGPRMS